MLRHFLTLTLRNGFRQPLHTVLNLLCLTLGLAAALLIGLYLHSELTYDRFHANARRIYRVETKLVNLKDKVLEVGWHNTPSNLAAFIKQDYPEVENYVRFFKFFSDEAAAFGYQGELFEEKDVYAVDSSVFAIFSFPFVAGNPAQALSGPNKIVLSRSLARRIFGEANPIGKTLESRLSHNLPGMREQYALMVTGVYEDLPPNTHLPVQAMISAQTDPGLAQYYFGTYNTLTYLLLPATTDPGRLAPKFTQIYDRYLDPAREPVMANALHELMPLMAIHLADTGGITYLYIFGAVGLLLLLIAVISYVNLVTAQAGRRGVEIGIRKVLGSHRGPLVAQFLLESLFFTLLALLAGASLVAALVDPLNHLLGLQLEAGQLGNPQMLAGMLCIGVITGLLGGSYPAFFLSSFEPVSVMKGKGSKRAPLRRVLVGIQFAVVLFVLSCTGMVYNQLQYLRKKDLGFSKEQVIRLNLPGQRELQQWPALKNALQQSPYITSAAAGSFIFGADQMVRGPVSADGSVSREPQFVYRGGIDYDFLATLNIRLKAGRNFSRAFPSDLTHAALVNETFVRKFGLKQPLGEKIRYGNKGNPNHLEIIGVVADFHQSTLHTPIEPSVFVLNPSSPNVVIKTEKDFLAAVKHLEKSWKAVLPGTPLDYRFLDQELQDGYQADQIRGRVFLFFSLVTLGISFLGLFGLAAYLAAQRTREVGIRRVLGAGTGHLVLLLTRDFLLLVAAAALPAFGVAWYTLRRWLENFAYRAEVNYLLFGLVLVFTLLLTFGVTGLHAFRTAQLNPADTLKHE
jgi:putative ABC transport system permease protein